MRSPFGVPLAVESPTLPRVPRYASSNITVLSTPIGTSHTLLGTRYPRHYVLAEMSETLHATESKLALLFQLVWR